MATIDVKFVVTSAATFATITPVAGTFYRVTNTDSSVDVYLGSVKLNNEDEIASAIAALDSEIITSGTAGDGQIMASVSVASDAVNVLTGVTEVDGVLTAATATTLSKLASTGAAEDVSISDTDGNFTATDVEGALAELAEASAGGVSSKTVYMTSDTSSTDYAAVYSIYQGATGSSASPVASELIGTINLPKDMVATAGELVTVKTDGTVYNQAGEDITSTITGTIPTVTEDSNYIMLSIANGDQFFVAVQGLIDVYEGSADVGTVSEGVAINVSDGVISATVVTLDGSKLDSASVAKTALASGVQSSLDLADSAVQSVAEGSVAGAISVDGTTVAVHGLADVATSGDASDVAIADAGSLITATNVEDALQELAANSSTGVDTKIATAIGALDADVDATGTAAYDGVFVVSGVTEVDGVITAVDSVEVDAAGTAATVQTTVIGASGDASTADTIYGAKAYADSLATNYDPAGSASAVQTNLETALTWETLE